MQKTVTLILSTLLGLTVLAIAAVVQALFQNNQLNVQLSTLLKNTPPRLVAAGLLIVLVWQIGLIAWIILLRSKHQKLLALSKPNYRIENGIYYDALHNAYCPTCKTLMAHQFPSHYDENYWYCGQCNRYFAITPNDDDKRIIQPFTID